MTAPLPAPLVELTRQQRTGPGDAEPLGDPVDSEDSDHAERREWMNCAGGDTQSAATLQLTDSVTLLARGSCSLRHAGDAAGRRCQTPCFPSGLETAGVDQLLGKGRDSSRFSR